MSDFTPQEAIFYAQNDRLEDWLHAFLLGPGNNEALSTGLKRQQRWWHGPSLVDLAQLERCCGPEESMEYYEPLESFERRADEMAAAIRAGWEPAPLIVQFSQNAFSIRDGNHRHEALLRSGYERYWVIVWCDSQSDLNRVIEHYKLDRFS